MPHAVRTHTTATSASKSAATFRLPIDHHLIVTTSGGIFSWDREGIKKVFSSSKKGILAAREAGDGSQLLAVADKHVVVLHDCKRGREESWGLNSGEGNVRLLEYASDGKSLFLSTSLTGAIQRYSISESRLLDPPQNHPSPPTVLAVCPASHLMISASENPPVIYLKNLTLNTPAVQLHPSASSAPVATASFHPERPNIFLLAFKDGTLAAYDATKVNSRVGIRVDGKMSLDGRSGEISRFLRLHRVSNIKSMSDPSDAPPATTIGSTSVGVTGAAFLTGYRSRAVSTGADGRCRIVDFEAGGRIIRTWHAQAPITSLSVLTIQASSGVKALNNRRQPVLKSKTPDSKGPASATTIVAVGRVDGQVLLFDALGLKLDQVVVNELGEDIIGVEWMKGPSPDALPKGVTPAMTKQIEKGLESQTVRWTGQGLNHGLPTVLELPPAAVFAPTRAAPTLSIALSVQDEAATVRHVPGAVMYSPVPASQTTYLDLFSPVKQVKSPPNQQARRSPESAAHARPRLSSQTFIKSSSPESTPRQSRQELAHETPQHVSIHPLSTTITSASKRPPRLSPLKFARRTSVRSSPKFRNRALSRVTPVSSGSRVSSPVAVTRNGQVLADLRKLGAGNNAAGKAGASNIAMFAPYMNRTGVSSLPRTGHQQSVEPEMILANPQHEEPSTTHVTASDKALLSIHIDSESHSSDRDIWLSAGSSDNEQLKRMHDQRSKRKHHQQHDNKPRDENIEHPSQLVCSGAIQSPKPRNESKRPEVLSMSDDAMYTALSNLDGEFVPTSTEVRKLFPRGSSLSNSSSPHRSPHRHLQVWNDGAQNLTGKPAEKKEGNELAQVQPNAILRATKRHDAAKEAALALLGQEKASKSKALPALPAPAIPSPNPKTRQVQQGKETQAHSAECMSVKCAGCMATEDKVRNLEQEVARLKAEVLGLKSVVRKGVLGRVKGVERRSGARNPSLGVGRRV